MRSYDREKMSLGARALWILCRAVAIMPHWFKYGCVERVIYFVMRYIVHYRRKLIISQLTTSFPDRSQRQIKEICNDYYHTLAENFVGTMTLAGMSRSERSQVLEVTLSEEVKRVVKGRDVVYLSSHLNFWEYAQFSISSFEEHVAICAYHPLKSKVWDELFYHLRCNEDALPVPSGQLIRYFLEHREGGVDGRRMFLGLVADQNASPKGDVHWYNFLNRPTLFFEGGEQLAVKYHLPVLYLGLKRLSSGRYRGEVTLLYDGEQSVAKHEITERYVRQLEQDILQQPSGWMWSHRRWKYYPDPETGEVVYIRKGV